MRRAGGLSIAMALVLAACDGGGPQPGNLVVRLGHLSAAPPHTRAVKFRLVGPSSGVTAPTGSGLTVISAPLTGDTTIVATFALASDTVDSRVIAVLAVPDVHAAGQYHATLIEAAGLTYGLVAPSVYTLTVALQ